MKEASDGRWKKNNPSFAGFSRFPATGRQRMDELVHQWANDIFVWIGFGTVVGLCAKAVLPGKDQGGAIATLLIGIAGAVIGSGILAYFWEGHRVTPLSPLGFVVATAGAFVLLFFHRLLSGYLFK